MCPYNSSRLKRKQDVQLPNQNGMLLYAMHERIVDNEQGCHLLASILTLAVKLSMLVM